MSSPQNILNVFTQKGFSVIIAMVQATAVANVQFLAQELLSMCFRPSQKENQKNKEKSDFFSKHEPKIKGKI